MGWWCRAARERTPPGVSYVPGCWWLTRCGLPPKEGGRRLAAVTSRALSPSSGLTSPLGTTGQAGLASSGRGGNHLGAPSILRPPRVTARMDREGVPRFELSVTPPRPRPLMGAARAVGDQAGHARRRLLSVVSAVVACAVDVLGGGAPRVVKWSFLPRAGPVRQRGTRPRLVHRERRGARHAVQGGYEIGRGTRCGAVQVSSV